MRPTHTIAASLLAVVVIAAGSLRAQPATSVQWLSDRAVAYLGDDARLDEAERRGDPWRLGQGTVRIACQTPVEIIALGHTVIVEPGLAVLDNDQQRLRACAEEGELLVGAHRISAGECIELDAAGQPSDIETDPENLAFFPPPVANLHPVVEDDPWLALETTLGSLGGGSSGGATDGENVEAGAAAACLDSSSSGVDSGGPEAPELVQPEVDRDGHLVHIEVTLEDF